MSDRYLDVLIDLARNNGACLYWQMGARARAAFEAGIVRMDEFDLLVHPDAVNLGPGAYHLPTLSLFELSAFEEGKHLFFTKPFGDMPKGSRVKVKDNGLNEIWSAILLEPVDPALRAGRDEWDGCLHIAGGDPGLHQDDEDDSAFAAEWLVRLPLEPAY